MKLFTKRELKEEREASNQALRLQEAALVKSLHDRIEELNKTLPTLDEQLKLKQQEVSAAKLEYETVIRKHTTEVEQLEERRRVALVPLEAERRQLEDKRIETTRCLLQLGEKQLEIAEKLETLRRKEDELVRQELTIKTLREETSAKLDKEQAETLAFVEGAKQYIKALEEARAKHKAAVDEAEAKIKSAAKAKMTVEAMMIETDRRIAKAEAAESRVDDKKKSLAAAINEFKLRGLWKKL